MPRQRTADEISQHIFTNCTERSGDCIIWTKASQSAGYGNVRYEGKLWQAHRLVWVLINGPIPKGMVIMHKCDNRKCVNPNHLQLGTQVDNIIDMERKGRARKQKGAEHHNAKLSQQQVEAIRIAYANGLGSQSTIARQYGVTQAHISKIVRRDFWNHD